jgi:hypothetical protein
MRLFRWSTLLLITAGALAQMPNAPVSDRALRDARHRYTLVATKATALFASMDSLEGRLSLEGSTIHPGTGALRLRIENTLHDAEAALADRDLKVASLETKLAEELVSRLAKRIGGE